MISNMSNFPLKSRKTWNLLSVFMFYKGRKSLFFLNIFSIFFKKYIIFHLFLLRALHTWRLPFIVSLRTEHGRLWHIFFSHECAFLQFFFHVIENSDVISYYMKKSTTLIQRDAFRSCRKRDLNPHDLNDHRHLKPARLPIPPFLHFFCAVALATALI